MLLIPASSAATSAQYQIARSLRFRSLVPTYLTRTPAVASDQKKWTWAGWAKRSTLGGCHTFFNAWNANNDAGYCAFYLNTLDQLTFQNWSTNYRVSNAIYRDPSAPMFVLLALDAANLVCRIEVNGVAINSWASSQQIANQNYAINSTIRHNIGRRESSTPDFWADGYMSDINFIDGQYLDSTSFGQFDPATGAWVPKKYTGAYGVNGFHLDFADNSAVTAAALGKDTSGNGNNWLPNNFSVTVGTANDSMTDTPTNYGIDSLAGGEVRGNYPTFTPLAAQGQGSNYYHPLDGNLCAYGNGYQVSHIAPFGMRVGQWYWELLCYQSTNALSYMAGIQRDANLVTSGVYVPADAYIYYAASGGIKYNNNASAGAYPPSFTTGDVLSFMYDATRGILYAAVNGVLCNAATIAEILAGTTTHAMFSSIPAGSYNPVAGCGASGTVWQMYGNFGQQPFDTRTATLRAGLAGTYKVLCTQNLPDPAIKDSSKYFDVRTRPGLGTGGSVTNLGFQPDLLWSKTRSVSVDHFLADSVRGPSKVLSPNLTAAEDGSNVLALGFLPNGYSYGASAGIDGVGRTFVDWLWKKGAVPGIDIVAVPSASAAAIPHALGVKPAMIIIKARPAAPTHWFLTHQSLGANMQDWFLALNLTQALVNSPGCWGGEPTSTQFYAGSTVMVAGNSFVAYLFAEVPGFSKFGLYSGNNAVNGNFIPCGFRPRWILIKEAGGPSSASGEWAIFDAARNTGNPLDLVLWASGNYVENSATRFIDFLSNGFKIRSGTDIYTNESGGAYIYAAFAERPFKYARAR